jgi:predicted lactoylglutathione lyase
MTTDVFINIPTTDLPRAKAFFEALGWRIEPNFTNDDAACVVVDDHVFLMVLTLGFFATFTDKPIADPHTSVQIEVSLSRESRTAVDALADAAIAAGGKEPRPAQDYGFMYSRGFEDPDGNLFGAVWMDAAAAAGGPEAFEG